MEGVVIDQAAYKVAMMKRILDGVGSDSYKIKKLEDLVDQWDDEAESAVIDHAVYKVTMMKRILGAKESDSYKIKKLEDLCNDSG